MSEIVVGISGASGAALGVETLRALRHLNITTHLVVSDAARQTLAQECQMTLEQIRPLADHWYPAGAIGAAIASGSFKTMGMIVAPCSIRTMSEIATGVTSSLLTRAADVTLKERRRLVLMVRESPLHTGHLTTMTTLSQMGAIIAPPVPAFYTNPSSVQDIVTNIVGRTLDLFDLDAGNWTRWDGPHSLPNI